MLLRRMRRDDVTTHGFRSTFRDWVAEQTDFADPIAEAALAHESGDATERAYRRSSFLAKRRRLMDAWGAFCASVDSAHDVLPLERR
jgi:integrase